MKLPQWLAAAAVDLIIGLVGVYGGVGHDEAQAARGLLHGVPDTRARCDRRGHAVRGVRLPGRS